MNRIVYTLIFFLSLGNLQAESLENKHDPALEHILTGEPTIDEAKAEVLLKACQTLDCQGYAIYFASQKIKDSTERKKFIEEKVTNLLTKSALEKLTVGDTLSIALLVNLDKLATRDTNTFPDLEVPLWLVLKEKEILQYDSGNSFKPYPIIVKADDHIENLPAYDQFSVALKEVDAGYWDGEGTIKNTLLNNNERKKDILSFAPELIQGSEADIVSTLVNPSLEKWAFLGPWNFHKYHQLREAFEKMRDDLKGYYESYEYLDRHAPYSANYLNDYVSHFHEGPIELISDKAFEVFKIADTPLEDLKKNVKDFSKDDWNGALSYAILNNYGIEVIDWILSSGADVNASIENETPIIKASNRPDILKFLLQKGANVEGSTPFGKTALFYAVQFNNLDSVITLVEAGANVNATLTKDKNKLSELGFELEKVIGFKPLAYSMRYGSEELTQYLLSKGANIKNISLHTLKDWVKDEERYKAQLELIENR